MDLVTINSLESSLISIFNSEHWTPLQQQTYTLIKNYVQNFREDSRKSEIKDDRMIIRRNLTDQIWFLNSKSKPLLSLLLDHMSLTSYVFDQNDDYVNLMLCLSFKTFDLHVCFYLNRINHFSNFYIYFENPQHQKAYMTYYTNVMGTDPNTNVKKLQLPEFTKIYQVTGINSQMFYQYDLLIFFAEIAMYYDESGLIGNIQISHSLSVTLNQLIAKFNGFVVDKNTG